MSELGNLMAGILLSLRRMSTVKIRARSLFCTIVSRIGAGRAGFGREGHVENLARAASGPQQRGTGAVFLSSPQSQPPLHSLYTSILNFALAGNRHPGAKSNIEFQKDHRTRWNCEGSKKRGLGRLDHARRIARCAQEQAGRRFLAVRVHPKAKTKLEIVAWCAVTANSERGPGPCWPPRASPGAMNIANLPAT